MRKLAIDDPIATKDRLPDRTAGRRSAWAAGLVALVLLIAAGVFGARLVRVLRGTDLRTAHHRPNLLVVTLDTCRKDHLSVYGYGRDTSPGLVALSRDAFVFENAFTVATTSAPSHATILTGLYPSQHGLVDNGLALPDAVPTLAEFLTLAGYDAAAFVGYYAIGPESRLDQGFATFRLDEIDDHAHATRSILSESRSFDAATDWLAERRRRGAQAPFFVWLQAQHMHEADPPRPYDTLFLSVPRRHDVAGFVERPFDIRCHDDVLEAYLAGRLTPELQAEVIALYDAEVRFVDDRLAVLIDGLRSDGVYDDTVIVVVADHGEMFFEKPGGVFGTIEPDHTATYFDEVLRVPLIVKPAGSSGLRVGARIAPMVSTVDLVPTILDLLHHERFPWLAGRSRMPLMENPREPVDERIFFEETPMGERCAGMRTPEWKLITTSDEDGSSVSLIDLANDPREERDVAASAPERRDAMLTVLREWLASQEAIATSAHADMSEKMREALRRAGYLRDRKR